MYLIWGIFQVKSVVIYVYMSPPKVNTTYKALSKISTIDFNSHLHNLDWTIFSTSEVDFNIEHGLSALTTNLQDSIDILSLSKIIKPQNPNFLGWIQSFAFCNLNAMIKKRYLRTGSRHLLNEFLDLANSYEKPSEMARCAYMHNRISGALDADRNFWREMKSLGFIPKASDALHVFLPYYKNLTSTFLIYQSLLIRILWHP